jgi:diguanylate cyclase (GGDEF)-like protein
MSLTWSIEPTALPNWATTSLSTHLNTLMARLKHEPTQDLHDLLLSALDCAAEAEQTIATQSARIAELEALSQTDPLTGLANRRGFELSFVQAVELANRHDETGVVILIDMDYFKAINDSYGHDAGDAALCHTARTLQNGLRSTDVLARIGGDEFAAVLLRADPIAGMQQAERLQEMLNASILRWRNIELPVHASFGACTFGPGDDFEVILRRADMAMYTDKRNRRHEEVRH